MDSEESKENKGNVLRSKIQEKTLRKKLNLRRKRNYGESRIKQVKLLRAQGGCPGTERR